ncbi:MAG: FlgK family flagellar hook-associated protein, partial [Campylobacterota bacterium]
DDGAIKIDLATRTQTMTNSIQSTREKVEKLQTNINDDIEVAVNEINRLAEGIAELNEKISTHESGGINNANDLRDQRDKLEKALNEIVNTSVTKTNMSSKSEIDHNIHDYNDQYTLNVGGFNIIDGADFHPVSLDSDNNNSGYHEINFVRKDLKKFPMEDAIHGGRLGAMLDMRGREYDVSKKGFIDGELQDTLDGLDQLANSLIESTNNLYAQSPSQSMSSTADVEADYSLLNSDVHINEGSFMVNVYNNNGEVVSSKEVSIDSGTIFDGPGANTIVNKINSDTDDNGDSNSNNDIDDFLQATFKDGKLVFDMNDSAKFNGYTFNITEKDAKNPTNFAGAMGMNQFFEGSDARDIGLNINLQNRPSDIQAGTTPNSGDKALANDMQQLQFEKVNFYSRNSHEVQSQETLERFFTQVAGGAASRSADVDAMHDSNTALFNSVKSEYDSISKVSIDEELTNLIKFQTGYQAAAKVITTVDQMINSLLQML